jgi:hypothetical protein
MKGIFVNRSGDADSPVEAVQVDDSAGGGLDGRSVGRREALLGAAGGAGLGALAFAGAAQAGGRSHGHTDDWQEIFNLLSEYSYSIDAGDLVTFSAQYRHGTWNGLTEAGMLALLRRIVILYPENLTYDQGGRGKPLIAHIGTNAVIDVAKDGKTASSVSIRTGIQGVTGVPGVVDFPLQPIFVIRYDDTFHKLDGKWWFKTTRLTSLVSGNRSYHTR